MHNSIVTSLISTRANIKDKMRQYLRYRCIDHGETRPITRRDETKPNAVIILTWGKYLNDNGVFYSPNKHSSSVNPRRWGGCIFILESSTFKMILF